MLIVFHIQNKPEQYHNFTHHGDIDCLELHTLSTTDGVTFKNENDNTYLKDILLKSYDFNTTSIVSNGDQTNSIQELI